MLERSFDEPMGGICLPANAEREPPQG